MSKLISYGYDVRWCHWYILLDSIFYYWDTDPIHSDVSRLRTTGESDLDRARSYPI